MKLFTINATPVQSYKQQVEAGYDLNATSYLDINKLHLAEYPSVVANVMQELGIDGFTIYQVQGYWKGEAEASFKIEIAIDEKPERVYTVAEQLKDIYNQESVMLTLPNNTVKFI